MPKIKSKYSSFKAAILSELQDIKEAGKEAFLDYASDVVKTAKEMSPADSGDLEDSIRIENVVNANNTLVVKIVADPIDPETGEQYGEIAHERITPAGPWKLGPGSQDKMDSTGAEIGGGFLERAIFQTDIDLEKRIREEMKK